MWPELEKEEACGNGISGWWRRCRGDAVTGKRRGSSGGPVPTSGGSFSKRRSSGGSFSKTPVSQSHLLLALGKDNWMEELYLSSC